MVAEMTAVICHHCHRLLKNRIEGRLHLIFALPLTSSKILSLEKTQKYFGFLLTYSYLCKLKQKTAS